MGTSRRRLQATAEVERRNHMITAEVLEIPGSSRTARRFAANTCLHPMDLPCELASADPLRHAWRGEADPR
jgi:hypothetical protein